MEDKDDLLIKYLNIVLKQFKDSTPFEDAKTPEDKLSAILEYAFTSPLPDRRKGFTQAMVELRAQAVHDKRYRVYFTEHDQFLIDRIATVIESGINQGSFKSVNPEAVGALLVTTIHGSLTEQVTSQTDHTTTIQSQVEEFVQKHLFYTHEPDFAQD